MAIFMMCSEGHTIKLKDGEVSPQRCYVATVIVCDGCGTEGPNVTLVPYNDVPEAGSVLRCKTCGGVVVSRFCNHLLVMIVT